MNAYVKEIDILLETEIFNLKYVKVQDIIEQIKEILKSTVNKTNDLQIKTIYGGEVDQEKALKSACKTISADNAADI